eukprot:519868_1
MTTTWTMMMACPNHEYTDLCVPTGINKENYMAFGGSKLGHDTNKFEVDVDVDDVYSLYKYDVDANSWEKVIDLPTVIDIDEPSAVDTNMSVLWLHNSTEVI